MKGADLTGHTLCDSSDEALWRRHSSAGRKQMRGCQGVREEEGGIIGGAQRIFRVVKILHMML